MAEEQLSIRYTGEAVDSGEMDAREFASSLIGFADTLQIAATELNLKDDSRPVIKIRDVREGSFIADLVIYADFGIFEHAKAYLAGKDMSALANLGGVIGLASTAMLTIKSLAGRGIKKAEPVNDEQGQVHLTLTDNSTTIINGDVYNLLQNSNFNQAARKAVKPLDSNGVSGLEVSRPSSTEPGESEQVLKVNKFEAQYYEPRNDGLMPNVITEPAIVRFTTVKLDARGKWAVTDDENNYSVVIEDEEFLEAVKSASIDFNSATYYNVALRKETSVVNGRLKHEYFINKVHGVAFVSDELS